MTPADTVQDMTKRRNALTVLALTGAVLATTAVPASASGAIPAPGPWQPRTCHTVFQVPQKVRVDSCTNGTRLLFVWNRNTASWRLVWDR